MHFPTSSSDVRGIITVFVATFQFGRHKLSCCSHVIGVQAKPQEGFAQCGMTASRIDPSAFLGLYQSLVDKVSGPQ